MICNFPSGMLSHIAFSVCDIIGIIWMQSVKKGNIKYINM